MERKILFVLSHHYVEAIVDERFIESNLKVEDPTFEAPLRPKSLEEFVGQKGVCERLEVLFSAAKGRKEALSHCLFCGPPGLGKTTLAHILACEMGSNITVTSGAAVEKAGDLAGLLTHLQAGDILFIDEMHRLPRAIEEYLYPAMEDFSLDLMLDSGPAARSVQVELKPFTLVGATTRAGQLTSPLRSRFGMTLRLDYYPEEMIREIVRRSSRLMLVELSDGAVGEIAKRARGTPRVANNLLRWVRDFAQTRGKSVVEETLVIEALNMLQIDAFGLDEMDKRLLSVLCRQYDGGPVGLSTLAVAVGEEKQTLEEVYEPYLILRGLIKRTPRGREATPLAFSHLGK